MSLVPGVRLGAYEIVSLIGSGGMGEVYRARDTRLGRDVAIKVIPPAYSADADRLQRFEQEARAAALLNHPNILAVFDVGTYVSSTGSGPASPYIVSELLEGETLRERLAAGPLPVRKAIDFGIQMAQALAAAHEKGIIHRDLKPENIFINRDGRAKVLDFGLAKLTQPDSPLVAGTNLPTTPPANQTQAGLILGTIGYMAPEQVRGLKIDHRADVFAFGAILYEMLSGVRAFRGDTTIDTITSILKEDPPDLPVAERHIPPALARIVDRCLEKDAASRFHSMHDLAIALDTHSSQSTTSIAVPTMAVPGRRRAWLPWAIAGVTSLAALLGGAWIYLNRPVETPTFRSTLLPPEGVIVDEAAPSRLIALSPDGRRLAFAGSGPDRQRMLWVRSLDSLTAQQLAGSEDAFSPFWSPDSRRVGFFSGNAGGKLKTIDLDGGPPTTLCDYVGTPVGADWNADGVILFSTTLGVSDGALRRVSASGGTPQIVLAPDIKAGERDIWWPAFLPDGRHFLYLSLGTGRTPLAVSVASLDSPGRTLVMKGGSNVRYADGRVIFLRGGTLMSQRFDTRRLELQGEAVPVAEGVQTLFPTGAFTVSQTGLLAYKSGGTVGGSRLIWFDTAGRQLGTVGGPAAYGDLSISPDGKRAAVTLPDSSSGARDVWLVDLTRDLMTRFTFDRAEDNGAVWSPDGTRLTFRSNRNGAFDLFEKPSNGSGVETSLLADKANMIPLSWSADGRLLLYTVAASKEGAPPQPDLWVLPSGGDKKPFPFLTTPFSEVPARFSPDGRWVAYVSNESGQNQVYVVPFPGPGGKWQISTQGGASPVWRPDGKEIFYMADDARLMAAAVSFTASGIEIGSARPLFQLRPSGPRSFYDVAPDGRFLVVSSTDKPESSPITLVVNWMARMSR